MKALVTVEKLKVYFSPVWGLGYVQFGVRLSVKSIALENHIFASPCSTESFILMPTWHLNTMKIFTIETHGLQIPMQLSIRKHEYCGAGMKAPCMTHREDLGVAGTGKLLSRAVEDLLKRHKLFLTA